MKKWTGVIVLVLLCLISVGTYHIWLLGHPKPEPDGIDVTNGLVSYCIMLDNGEVRSGYFKPHVEEAESINQIVRSITQVRQYKPEARENDISYSHGSNSQNSDGPNEHIQLVTNGYIFKPYFFLFNRTKYTCPQYQDIYKKLEHIILTIEDKN